MSQNTLVFIGSNSVRTLFALCRRDSTNLLKRLHSDCNRGDRCSVVTYPVAKSAIALGFNPAFVSPVVEDRSGNETLLLQCRLQMMFVDHQKVDRPLLSVVSLLVSPLAEPTIVWRDSPRVRTLKMTPVTLGPHMNKSKCS